jgi:hypothetical protein
MSALHRSQSKTLYFNSYFFFTHQIYRILSNMYLVVNLNFEGLLDCYKLLLCIKTRKNRLNWVSPFKVSSGFGM